ncbi:hypothetical protein DVS28_b0059 (plasmid) [Euzebya pacifica]|uniref:Uncharacterized protein n=1 Tax=Euzebya pacifica TaxID=1608957 RepID=A0A346Y5T2_9ACTN|nr:hypothetical protein [Euzebya pacifica]AXV09829.1 hypothetical protein DVS28_b0059 [Euzebya pacifica]
MSTEADGQLIAEVTHRPTGHPQVRWWLPSPHGPPTHHWADPCPTTAHIDLFGCGTCAEQVKGHIEQAADAWRAAAHHEPLTVDVDGVRVPHHVAARYAPIGRLAPHGGPAPERAVVHIGTVHGHLVIDYFVMAATDDSPWRITPARRRPLCDGPAPEDGETCQGCIDAAWLALSRRRFTVVADDHAVDTDTVDDIALLALLATARPVASNREDRR